ncbi:hypothetical protein Sru01_29710 [Sphaerisporangium rufum]|uniref:Uncharacterized protein n=1 Tax=Sphaerisporangium rufum TaxID=1381558 RepID=A0A919R1P1_9ACTN|nr:hypothetical protein Sru01_29710 [Sphaerisporangium rufum]
MTNSGTRIRYRWQPEHRTAPIRLSRPGPTGIGPVGPIRGAGERRARRARGDRHPRPLRPPSPAATAGVAQAGAYRRAQGLGRPRHHP